MTRALHLYIDRATPWVAAIAAALPCFYLSWVLFNVWHEPMAWGDGSWVRLGVGLLLLEFILLHSGAFMVGVLGQQEDFKQQMKMAVALLTFYALMVWAFAVSLDTPVLIWIFAGIILGRSLNLLLEPSASKQAIMARSGIGVLLYLLVVFATVFIPIPELGITGSVLSEVYPDRGAGLWEREPERAIAGAAVYFMLIGLAEITVLRPGKTGLSAGVNVHVNESTKNE
jgi:hypothetical protein